MLTRLRILAEGITGRMKPLRAFVFRRSADRELAEELSHHIELETEENIRSGMEPAEARRAALAAFGNVDRYAERVRDARWTIRVEDVIRDLRYTLRSLGRSPVFAVTVVLTLALGIGANTALYSVIHGFVFRMPAGVPESDRLVRMHDEAGWRTGNFSHADLRDLQAGVEDAVAIAGHLGTSVGLRVRGEPVRVSAQLVSDNFFEVLGLHPSVGRWFLPEENAVPGRDAVVVLSHATWRSHFAGADDVIGADVSINGHFFRVVGIAPPGFRGVNMDENAELWLPFMTQPWAMPRANDVLGSRNRGFVNAIGRLAPNVSTSQAQAALEVAAARLPGPRPSTPIRPVVEPLRGWVPAGDLLNAGAVLGFAGILTGLVLLICCANVAGLQLARVLDRRREIAVRSALGAGRARIVRMLLTESVVLAIAAGMMGILLAWGLARVIQHMLGSADAGSGMFGKFVLTPDATSLLFTFGLAFVAGLIVGLMPALRVAKPGLMPTMNGATRSGGGDGRLRATLVGSQVALSLVLLVAAGMFLTRLNQINDIDPGFDPERLAAFSVDLQASGYDEAERVRFFDELRDRLARVPGVTEVTAPTHIPFTRSIWLNRVERLGDSGSPDNRDGAGIVARVVGIGGSYFDAMEVSAVRGRTLRESDLNESERHAVISEPLARELWGDGNPIGESLGMGTEMVVVDGDTTRVPSIAVVVGTVRPLQIDRLGEPAPMQVYLPANRSASFADQGVLVRTAGPAAPILPMIREVAQSLDAELPVVHVRTLASDVHQQLGTHRAVTRLIGAFGAIGFLLALVGLYGVVASTVAARTREIGVRIALGARPDAVTGLFVRGGMRVVAYGLVAGTILALGVGRLIAGIVWGVRPFEPPVLFGTALLLIVMAAAASWIPARRASRVDPMVVLREE